MPTHRVCSHTPKSQTNKQTNKKAKQTCSALTALLQSARGVHAATPWTRLCCCACASHPLLGVKQSNKQRKCDRKKQTKPTKRCAVWLLMHVCFDCLFVFLFVCLFAVLVQCNGLHAELFCSSNTSTCTCAFIHGVGSWHQIV